MSTVPSHIPTQEARDSLLALNPAVAAMRRELDVLRRRESHQSAALSKLREEIEQAARFQRQLLPSSLPTVQGADLDVVFRPADGVGGDLYDAARLDETKVALFLADAAGHGLAAGLLGAFVRGALGRVRSKKEASMGVDPAEVLTQLNREVMACGLADCEFVTAVHAVYDEAAQTLRWSRAGAPYPVLIQTDGEVRLLCGQGSPLGVEAEALYHTQEVRLRPGDGLVFHTDGLDSYCSSNSAVGGPAKASFAEWLAYLDRNSRCVQSIPRRLKADLAQRVGRAYLDDDLTVLTLHRHS